jgi:hypothetical protein
MTYSKAAEYLGTKIDRPYGSGRNTRMIRRDANTIAIRLHATDVVTFKSDGRIILDSGGWQTATTKARMNEAIPGPCGVYQKDHTWYLRLPSQPDQVFFDRISFRL